MTFYKFIVDTTTFSLSYASIQFSVFGRIIDEPVSVGRVYYDQLNATFYVDADLDSFRLIISTLRGYDIDVNSLSKELYTKFQNDLIYFVKQGDELQENKDTNQIYAYISSEKTKLNLLENSDSSYNSDSDEYY